MLDVEAKIGGIVPSIEEDPEGFDINLTIPVKEQRKMDRFIHFVLEAVRQAVEQAKWFLAITEAVRTVEAKGVRRLSPFTIPSFLVNLAAGHVSIRYGFKGPIGAPMACAASAQAIGDGMRMLLSGEADIALCGGAECMS